MIRIYHPSQAWKGANIADDVYSRPDGNLICRLSNNWRHGPQPAGTMVMFLMQVGGWPNLIVGKPKRH